MTRFTPVALAVAALVTTPAFATSSSASASLGPLTIQLFDTNPLDAVTPSITFNPGIYGGLYDSYIGGSAYDSAASLYPSFYDWGASAFDPSLSNSVGTATSWAGASVSGTGSAAGTTLSASGWAVGPTSGNPTAYSNFQAYAAAPYSAYGATFTLSPGTVVVFSANASLSASADNFGSAYASYAYAYGSMSVSGPSAGGGGGGQYGSDSRTLSGYSGPTYSDGVSAPLAVSFVNLTALPMNGTFDQYVQVDGYAYAVPEPETYALMLAGLLVVGSLARRRRG